MSLEFGNAKNMNEHKLQSEGIPSRNQLVLDKSDSRIRFVRDILYSSLPSIFNTLKGFLILPILSKLMGSATYGIWVQFNVSIMLMLYFAALNLGYSMCRFLVGSQPKIRLVKDLNAILFLVFSGGIALGGFLFLSRHALANFLFGSERHAVIVTIMATCLPLSAVNIEFMAFLRARRMNRQLAFITIGKTSAQLLAVSLAALYTSDIVLILSSFAGVELIIMILLSFYIYFFLFRQYYFKMSFENIPTYLKFGIPLIPMTLASWVVQSSDRYVIGYFMNVSQVGIYSVAYTLAGAIGVLLSPVLTVLLPDLSDLYERKQVGELETRFQRIQKYYVAIGSATTVGLAILARPLIKVISSPEFIAGTQPLIILSVAFFFYGLFILYTQLLNVLKAVRLMSFLWTGLALLNLGANIILIPIMGLMGAAISTCLAFLIGAVVSGISASRSFHLSFHPKWLAQLGVSLGFMAIIVHFLPHQSFAGLLFAILGGMVVYGMSLKVTGFVDFKDYHFAKRALLSVFGKCGGAYVN